MSVSQVTHRTKLNPFEEVGTYFTTDSNKLFYIDGVVESGCFVIEDCKTNRMTIWTEQHIVARRTRVIVPEGGE